jgi:hypothetical protein
MAHSPWTGRAETQLGPFSGTVFAASSSQQRETLSWLIAPDQPFGSLDACLVQLVHQQTAEEKEVHCLFFRDLKPLVRLRIADSEH